MFVISTVIITGSATLRVLEVSFNDISDDGMALISEALQYNKSLTSLRVVRCGLSVKGTVVCVLEMYFFINQIIMKLLNTLYHLMYTIYRLHMFVCIMLNINNDTA